MKLPQKAMANCLFLYIKNSFDSKLLKNVSKTNCKVFPVK